jgi:hypothetical protein
MISEKDAIRSGHFSRVRAWARAGGIQWSGPYDPIGPWQNLE